MLQNRRRNRIARLIIGGMGSMPQKEGPGMDYDMDEKPKAKPTMSAHESLEMACGTMLAAIRSDDISLLCRSFKAAFRACEQYEDEMKGGY